MTRLMQLSDPHFGTDRPQARAALEQLVRELRPAVLIVSGDVTQRATAAQFAAARAWLDRLAVPTMLVIPGNHDIPLFNLALRVCAPYRRYRRAFGDELEPEHEDADTLVLALNTTRPWRHKQGRVSAAQIERVARRLERAAPAQLRIVVVHHPVALTLQKDRANLLRGHREALTRWSAAGADLILGGHIHLPFIVPLHARAPDIVARPLWAVQAGTALSDRLRGGVGNSVNVIDTRWRVATVARWDLGEGVGDHAGRYALASSQDLTPDG